MRRLLSLAVLLVPTAVHAADPPPADAFAAFAACAALGRGINLGNALEAPKEGEWGVTLKADYFRLIREAGFSHVRLPVKWSAHAAAAAPFAIDEAFAERVDWALDQAAANGLKVVLNVHHYSEMDTDPDRHLPRLIGLWEQIGRRYKDRPASAVYFELLNEPHDKLTPEKWNDAIPQLLRTVRATNPSRPVVVGPGSWNAIWALLKLTLPADPMLVVTVHYYEPFKFTHQGAHWASDDVKKLSGLTWTGTDAEVKALRDSFGKAAAWAKANNRPVYLGEFGAFEKADLASRGRWTAAVAREAERAGFAWAYWEFCSGFGAYDPRAEAWRTPLRTALVPPAP